MKKQLLHLLFLTIVCGELATTFQSFSHLEYVFKPMIMLWIAAYFFWQSRKMDKIVCQLAMPAFLFSWGGDIFMLHAHKQSFFLLGLGMFLIAHLFYAFLFLRTIDLSGKKPFLKKQPVWLTPFIIFGLIMIIVLFNQLDPILKLSVFLYLVVILAMAAMALNRYGNGHPISFSMVFSGALLFVFSDALIAINSFLIKIPMSHLWIMASYILAQYLIMSGLLKQYE